MRRRDPPVGKGIVFPFQVSVVCWFDLLGYGSMMAQANFNPLHQKAKEALKRLKQFHEIVAAHSSRHFPTLVMNDGAAAYRDLSLRSRSVTYDFLVRAWSLFEAIRAEEAKSSLPGARAVLACGFRMRGRRAGIDVSNTHFRSIVSRLQSGDLNIDQAVHEAASMRPTFDVLPQLQANFAFTKAYVAEDSGARGNLPGPNFYVDLVLLRSNSPSWLQLGTPVLWSDTNLNLDAKFAAVRGLTRCPQPEGAPEDILDGLEVAKRLVGNENVLAALRSARKP